MRGAVLSLIAIAACNPVFGLEPTKLVDAAYFDSPIDAPPRCPTTGGAPAFKDVFHQLDATGCTSYTQSDAGFAMVACGPPMMPKRPAKGGLDGPFRPLTYPLPPTTGTLDVRLAPEGDLALVRLQGFLPTLTYYDVVVPDATGEQWTTIGSIPTTTSATNIPQISTPSRGPVRHVIRVGNAQSSPYMLDELVGDGASWTVRDTYEFAPALGVSWIPAPMSLSPDGLRLVFLGVSATGPVTMYAERPSIDSRFGAAQPIASVPTGLEAPFLTSDCARLYFTVVDRVFYVDQQ